VLGGRQFLPATRQRWGCCLACGGTLTAVALAVGSLYFGFTGKFTHKPSVSQILGTYPESPPRAMTPANYLQASLFAEFIEPSNVLSTRFMRGGKALVKEFVQVFHYVGALAVVLGLWWFGKALRAAPASWVLATYAGVQTLVLIALSMRSFYVSDRHVMLLVLCAVFPATAGLMEAGRRLGGFLASRTLANPAAVTIAVVIVALGLGLPKTVQRLHGNRVGNHAAGLWLSDHLADGDLVLDDHCWSHYFAGLVFIEGKEPILPTSLQPTSYTVLTRSKDPEIGLKRYRNENDIRSSGGRLVYHWPENREPELARVVVYAQPRDFAKYPWNKRD